MFLIKYKKPWLDRLHPLLKFKNVNELDAKRYPKLNKYIAKMKERDEVKKTTLPDNVVLKYIEILAKGPAPYDGIDI